MPRSQKAQRELPPQNKSGDWFGRRTIEIFAYGAGTHRGKSYEAKHTSVNDDGCAVFKVWFERGATYPGPTSRWVTGVLDPALGKAREVASEQKLQAQWTATPFPISAGFVVEKKGDEYRVRAVDASTVGLSQSWNLGKRIPDRFVANGEILVAVTSPNLETGSLGGSSRNNLVCLESTGGRRSRWKTRVEAESKVVWEFDLSEEWAEEEPYTSFPHLKNFHITRQVILES